MARLWRSGCVIFLAAALVAVAAVAVAGTPSVPARGESAAGTSWTLREIASRNEGRWCLELRTSRRGDGGSVRRVCGAQSVGSSGQAMLALDCAERELFVFGGRRSVAAVGLSGDGRDEAGAIYAGARGAVRFFIVSVDGYRGPVRFAARDASGKRVGEAHRIARWSKLCPGGADQLVRTFATFAF